MVIRAKGATSRAPDRLNIDGAIDMPFIWKLRPDLEKDAMLSPDAIAESYWHRAHQDRSARELDVRPFKQSF